MYGNMPPFPTFFPRTDEAIKMVTLNLLTLLLANFYCNRMSSDTFFEGDQATGEENVYTYKMYVRQIIQD